MDEFLDQFCEDHINGGYGDILDQLAAEEFDQEGDFYCSECDDEGCECCWEHDDCPLDGDHETGLRDAGWGTDEDYGCFGGDDDFGGW